jgi:hypothetical protein
LNFAKEIVAVSANAASDTHTYITTIQYASLYSPHYATVVGNQRKFLPLAKHNRSPAGFPPLHIHVLSCSIYVLQIYLVISCNILFSPWEVLRLFGV